MGGGGGGGGRREGREKEGGEEGREKERGEKGGERERGRRGERWVTGGRGGGRRGVRWRSMEHINSSYRERGDAETMLAHKWLANSDSNLIGTARLKSFRARRRWLVRI